MSLKVVFEPLHCVPTTSFATKEAERGTGQVRCEEEPSVPMQTNG